MEELKNTIAKNLTYYRKKAGLTQIELAEKVCYSDKSISKWERAEAVPDVIVLKQLADFFNVSVDAFFIDDNSKKEKSKTNNGMKHLLITIMSVGIVWLVATIAFAFIGMIISNIKHVWLVYVMAVPISFIVLIVFSCLWGRTWHKIVSISGFIWSFSLTIYLMTSFVNNWLLFLIPIPIQVLVVLWFIFRKKFVNK